MSGIGVAVPAPPPGPGVTPPFVAPPTDKNRRGLLIGLGVGGLVLLLCCAGGLFGVGALIYSGINETKRQATAVVTVYLDSLRDRNYRAAHAQLCPSLADEVTVAELTADARREPFTQYRLEPPELGAYVEVMAVLSGGGNEFTKTYQLDTSGSRLKICRIL